MALNTAERAERLREKRKALGQKRVEYWVTPDEKSYLDLQLKLLRAQTGTSQPK